MANLLRKIRRRLDAAVGLGIEQTCLYELTAGEPRPEAALPAKFSLQQLSPERLRILPEPEAAKKRLAAGDACYLGFLDGRMAHYSWVKRAGIQPVTEAGRDYAVAQGEFWIYDCWTAEWARGRHIYPGVLAVIVQDHFGGGFTRGRIYTTRANVASQRGIVRAGFRQIAVLRSLRFGGRYWKLG